MIRLANKLLNLWAESGANILDDDTVTTLLIENNGTGTGLEARQSNFSSATVSAMRFTNSNASGVMLEFIGGVISTASINLAANKVVGAVRVHYTGSGGDGFGFVPIFLGVS